MRLGNSLRSSEKDTEPIQSRWDNLRDEEFMGETHDGPLNFSRHQNKIAIAMLTGDHYRGITATGKEMLGDDLKGALLEGFINGTIDDAVERDFIGGIMPPTAKKNGTEILRDEISGDKHLRAILSIAEGRGLEGRDFFTADAVDNFIKSYPLPMDFDEKSEEILDSIKRGGNTEAKCREYQEAMADFRHIIYGKQEEYWQAMKDLHKKAERYAKQEGGMAASANTADREAYTDELRQEAERLAYSPHQETSAEKATLPERYTEEEKWELLRQAKCEGDAYLAKGANTYSELTPSILEVCGLGPEYKAKVDNVQFGLSPVFSFIGGRKAAIGYVKTRQGVSVRGYYRSGSQGEWRLLPDYIAGTDGGVQRFGKGYSENSMMLPMELQIALNQIEQGQDSELVDQNLKTAGQELKASGVPAGEDIGFLMAGTAIRYQDEAEYWDYYYSGELKGSVYKEMSNKPVVLGAASKEDKLAPETLDIPGKQAPDFDAQVAQWRVSSEIYGDIEMKAYMSRNNKLRYIFSEDAEGRAWLGGVEVMAKITSSGLRAKWAELGDLATPLYEYKAQGGEYYGRADATGRYREMWTGYLSKMPIIQKYMEAQNH